MNVKQVLGKLKGLSDEKVRAHNTKRGAGDNQFGAKLGDIRKLAKAIKTNQPLAEALWETGNIDARHLAILLMKPEGLSVDAVDRMVRSVTFDRVADWLNAYIVRKHPEHEVLRERWMADTDSPMAARAGWSLTAARVTKKPKGLDCKALLDRIEAEMGSADPLAQWTMNSCLVEIGIHYPKYRKRALAIGETLGLYRDFPTTKGCTSPFAPIWIAEMVRRQH